MSPPQRTPHRKRTLRVTTCRWMGEGHLSVIGPCIALFTTRWRATAAIGAAAVIAGNLLAVGDGVWDTLTDLSGLITLIVVSVTATAVAAAMARSRVRQPQARLYPS